MNDRLKGAERIGQSLKDRKETVAVAETSAGGLLLATLLGVAGASAWVVGGVVPYSNEARVALLGPSALVEGSVVDEVAALALARAVRVRLGADWGIGESGIAGPQQGRRSAKPAGMICLAVVGPTIERTRTVVLEDLGRRANMQAFAREGLQLLEECLGKSLAR